MSFPADLYRSAAIILLIELRGYAMVIEKIEKDKFIINFTQDEGMDLEDVCRRSKVKQETFLQYLIPAVLKCVLRMQGFCRIA